MEDYFKSKSLIQIFIRWKIHLAIISSGCCNSRCFFLQFDFYYTTI